MEDSAPKLYGGRTKLSTDTSDAAKAFGVLKKDAPYLSRRANVVKHVDATAVGRVLTTVTDLATDGGVEGQLRALKALDTNLRKEPTRSNASTINEVSLDEALFNDISSGQNDGDTTPLSTIVRAAELVLGKAIDDSSDEEESFRSRLRVAMEDAARAEQAAAARKRVRAALVERNKLSAVAQEENEPEGMEVDATWVASPVDGAWRDERSRETRAVLPSALGHSRLSGSLHASVTSGTSDHVRELTGWESSRLVGAGLDQVRSEWVPLLRSYVVYGLMAAHALTLAATLFPSEQTRFDSFDAHNKYVDDVVRTLVNLFRRDVDDQHDPSNFLHASGTIAIETYLEGCYAVLVDVINSRKPSWLMVVSTDELVKRVREGVCLGMDCHGPAVDANDVEKSYRRHPLTQFVDASIHAGSNVKGVGREAGPVDTWCKTVRQTAPKLKSVTEAEVKGSSTRALVLHLGLDGSPPSLLHVELVCFTLATTHVLYRRTTDSNLASRWVLALVGQSIRRNACRPFGRYEDDVETLLTQLRTVDTSSKSKSQHSPLVVQKDCVHNPFVGDTSFRDRVSLLTTSLTCFRAQSEDENTARWVRQCLGAVCLLSIAFMRMVFRRGDPPSDRGAALERILGDRLCGGQTVADMRARLSSSVVLSSVRAAVKKLWSEHESGGDVAECANAETVIAIGWEMGRKLFPGNKTHHTHYDFDGEDGTKNELEHLSWDLVWHKHWKRAKDKTYDYGDGSDEHAQLGYKDLHSVWEEMRKSVTTLTQIHFNRGSRFGRFRIVDVAYELEWVDLFHSSVFTMDLRRVASVFARVQNNESLRTKKVQGEESNGWLPGTEEGLMRAGLAPEVAQLLVYRVFRSSNSSSDHRRYDSLGELAARLRNSAVHLVHAAADRAPAAADDEDEETRKRCYEIGVLLTQDQILSREGVRDVTCFSSEATKLYGEMVSSPVYRFYSTLLEVDALLCCRGRVDLDLYSSYDDVLFVLWIRAVRDLYNNRPVTQSVSARTLVEWADSVSPTGVTTLSSEATRALADVMVIMPVAVPVDAERHGEGQHYRRDKAWRCSCLRHVASPDQLEMSPASLLFARATAVRYADGVANGMLKSDSDDTFPPQPLRFVNPSSNFDDTLMFTTSLLSKPSSEADGWWDTKVLKKNSTVDSDVPDRDSVTVVRVLPALQSDPLPLSPRVNDVLHARGDGLDDVYGTAYSLVYHHSRQPTEVESWQAEKIFVYANDDQLRGGDVDDTVQQHLSADTKTGRVEWQPCREKDVKVAEMSSVVSRLAKRVNEKVETSH